MRHKARTDDVRASSRSATRPVRGPPTDGAKKRNEIICRQCDALHGPAPVSGEMRASLQSARRPPPTLGSVHAGRVCWPTRHVLHGRCVRQMRPQALLHLATRLPEATTPTLGAVHAERGNWRRGGVSHGPRLPMLNEVINAETYLPTKVERGVERTWSTRPNVSGRQLDTRSHACNRLCWPKMYHATSRVYSIELRSRNGAGA